MLSSAACALKRTRVPRTSSWGLNKAVKSRRQVVKPFPSKTASSATRSYALMKHTDPYIAADYESEPTITIHAKLRDDLSQQGTSYSIKLRKEDQLIPGVVLRGTTAKPMLIEVDPRMIHFLMKGPSTRFLGRRYILDVEGLAKYEVIPQNLDVEPVGYFPMAVTFTLWSKKAVPKSKLPPHVLKKFFEPLQAYDPVAEQMKQREEGTYQYTRFMGNGTQKENGHPLK